MTQTEEIDKIQFQENVHWSSVSDVYFSQPKVTSFFESQRLEKLKSAYCGDTETISVYKLHANE